METPFIRAQAKDSVDALDNLTAYLDPINRDEVVEYVISTFRDTEKLISHAVDSGIDPGMAFRLFVARFKEYWTAPSD